MPLQVVYTAVCGPINPISFDKKNKCFLFNFSDFSRKTRVYILKHKFKIFAALKNFKILVEKESGYVKSDQRDEFRVHLFWIFLAKNHFFHRKKISFHMFQ